MLTDLFEGNFDRYFATGATKHLWLFVHVPKTAGSSLLAEIGAILRPMAHIDIDYADTTRTYQAKYDAAVQKFIRINAEKPYRFVTGHIVERQHAMIAAAIPELRRFTMLREPIARLVSDYRYQRSPMNVTRAAFLQNTPSFETYLARKHVHNKIANHLVPRPLVEAGDIDGCVRHVMDSFAFVGLQEMYPLCLRALTTLLGQPRSPEAQIRVNAETDENRVVVSAELEQSLRRLNAVDVGIYQAFLARYRAIQEKLKARLVE